MITELPTVKMETAMTAANGRMRLPMNEAMPLRSSSSWFERRR
ncbi:MAG: hypothetical protein AAGC74_08790 [Verrucomicrobiota bacterium]